MQAEEKIIQIPLDQILEPSIAVRTTIILERLQELSRSIAQVGVILPLIVKPQGDKYEITDGHRRYLASKMVGKATAPCVIRSHDEVQADIVKIQANYHREDVNPIDEAKWFTRLHEKNGDAYNEIARLVSRSEAYVVQRVALLSADESIQAALAAGQIKVSQAKEILKSSNERVRQELLRVTVQNGATVAALRIMRADYDLRAGAITQEQAEQIAQGPTGPATEYMIECPCCHIKVGVNHIYPLSVCTNCHDGILAGAQEADRKEQEGGE